MSETLYILDAHSLIFQVFHAIPEMTSPDGQPTNAVYGFTRDVLNILHRKPDYVICAFDAAGPTVRHEIYPQYKANRGPMPDELRPQIDMILRLLDAFEIPVLALEGYEADDVIATVVTEAADRDVHAEIVSADKDIRQLIGDHIRMYNPRKDQFFDAQALAADWGIRPEQVVDFLALVGDPVDNVPGVPGVGPKTASKLLQQYGTLEGVLQHADEIKRPKLRESIRQSAEAVRLSRRLVQLERHLPLEIDWEACRLDDGYDRQRLLELFAEYGFNRFAQEVLASGPEPAHWDVNYQTVTSIEQLQKLRDELARQEHFCIDLETTSLAPMEAEIVGIALAWKPAQGWYVPLRSPPGQPRLDPAEVLAVLSPLLEAERPRKVGQNLKYDDLVLRRAGVRLAGVSMDSMVASYLLDAGQRNHNLNQLALRYLDHQMIPITDLIGKGRGQKRMDEVDVERVTQYAGEDADVALRLCEMLERRLREEGLWQLYDELERPLIAVLADMEHTGIAVDVPQLERLSAEYAARLEQIERDIYVQAGREFNIGSPAQLREVLFDELNLPILRRTKTGASTDQSVLEQLAGEHPLPGLLMEHRKLAKLKGTYLDALPQMVNPQTGRIHASFHQVVAATGRLSSSDPNLQNIPVRTEEGRQIRQAFVPGHAGWVLLAADYSQVELRMLAHFSGDAALRDAFQRDEDIHAAVAGQIYGVRPKDITPEMRRTAKTVNFGVIYGLSPFGLASRLGISEAEAAAFIDSYFARYPEVEKFIAKVLDQG
ncbi:MAG: DNA polymerase I, partial [Pirellulales bacterium]